ncbi:MAG TPA: aminopeptidase, partial [Lacipirellulaceae bacterium]|nr:aminopeptidase [Lacipirellulaceae bacterium]
MHDPRINRLADVLLDHSCRIQRGERVLIEAFDLPEPTLVCRLVEGAAQRGAVPFVSWKSNAVLRSLYQTASDESMKLAGQFESARMEQMQAYIGVRGAANSSQFADVPYEKMDLYQQHWWK